jgi:hypothetical protein
MDPLKFMACLVGYVLFIKMLAGHFDAEPIWKVFGIWTLLVAIALFLQFA